jgi:hypothetical protein
MGGFILVTGLGATHAAFADDDDWHSEADRPVVPEQIIRDRAELLASIAEKPQREQVYAPRSTLQPPPAERYIESSYQTATVDRPR